MYECWLWSVVHWLTGMGHVAGHSMALPKFLGEFKFLEKFKFLEEFCLTDRNWLGINLGIIISVFSDCIKGRQKKNYKFFG